MSGSEHSVAGTILDPIPCELGEGPLWHPTRKALLWFDILSSQMHLHEDGETRTVDLPEMASAAGWIDEDTVLLATDRGLSRLSLQSGALEPVMAVEADNPATRSNDGRADPWGGFWFGTMGRAAEEGAGAIYRFAGGELRKLLPGISIPNAISFPPDAGYVCYTDTPTRRIMRLRLDDGDGWPVGEPEVFVDLRAAERNPDGAVFDAEGNLWCAEWGSGQVSCYGQDGGRRDAVRFDAPQTSCPAFGGPEMTTLFCTTAREKMSDDDLAAHPHSGQTFAAAGVAPGQPEARVRL